jgi:ubiquinol-cytochrome c reductase cytochrome c subunit
MMNGPMTRLRQFAVALSAGALLALGGLVVFGSSSDPEKGSAGLSAPSPGALALAGRELFVARCSSCHGANGDGTANGPSLLNVGAAAADFELRTGRMPFTGPPGSQATRKPPAFQEREIQALVAFVASLGNGPAIPEPRIDLHLLSDGQRLYIANCAPCHGATANGGAVGGGALAPPLDRATSVEVAEAMLIGPGEMPVFTALAPTDRDAIVTYLDELRTAPNPGGFSIGGIGPVPEGFVAWVIGMGMLLIVVVLVGRDWRSARR